MIDGGIADQMMNILHRIVNRISGILSRILINRLMRQPAIDDIVKKMQDEYEHDGTVIDGNTLLQRLGDMGISEQEFYDAFPEYKDGRLSALVEIRVSTFHERLDALMLDDVACFEIVEDFLSRARYRHKDSPDR